MSAITQIEKYKNDHNIKEAGEKVVNDDAVHPIHPLHKEKPSEKKKGLVINPAFYSAKHDIDLTGNIINDGIHLNEVKRGKHIPRTINAEAIPHDNATHKHILLGGGLLVNTTMINVHKHHK